MKVKYSTKIPEIYEKCKKVFGVDWDKGVIITYGDTVYCKYPISPDLEFHEETHVRQQAEMGVEKWWDRYFVDKDFRLSQEVEAYRNQMKYANENYNRNQRRFLLKKICKDMATIYGGMCTENEAKKLLLKSS